MFLSLVYRKDRVWLWQAEATLERNAVFLGSATQHWIPGAVLEVSCALGQTEAASLPVSYVEHKCCFLFLCSCSTVETFIWTVTERSCRWDQNAAVRTVPGGKAPTAADAAVKRCWQQPPSLVLVSAGCEMHPSIDRTWPDMCHNCEHYQHLLLTPGWDYFSGVCVWRVFAGKRDTLFSRPADGLNVTLPLLNPFLHRPKSKIVKMLSFGKNRFERG